MRLFLPTASATFSHPRRSLPADEDSACPQLLCHMSQLRQKVPLRVVFFFFSPPFSQYFSPVARFAPGRCANPINRKPMAPPGQIKKAASSAGVHAHTYTLFAELSAAPADLCGAYKDNSCAPSTYIHMTNDNRSLA